MSLAIDPESVTAVLLTSGEWIDVRTGTFYLDSYEYVEASDNGVGFIQHGGGNSGVCATGFSFETAAAEPDSDRVTRICGPLTALAAVKERR